MNVFNFDYNVVVPDMFLMMAWGLFLGCFLSFMAAFLMRFFGSND